MIFCIQVNAFSPCLNCVDDRVRKHECRKWRKTGGRGRSHKQTSRNYWKADTSILVNPSFPHRDRFHKWDLHGFSFSELLSLHSSNKMVEEMREVWSNQTSPSWIHSHYSLMPSPRLTLLYFLFPSKQIHPSLSKLVF